jgi:integrase
LDEYAAWSDALPESLRDTPTADALRRLLDAVAVSDHPRCRIDPDTHRTLLLLLYGAGLRISEALALTLADVDLGSGILCIRESKFYKTRLVPIGADLIRILIPHAARRRQQHAESASPFFVSRKGDAVTRQNAEMAFCRLRVRANVIDETAATRHQPRLHDLRHNSEAPIIPSGAWRMQVPDDCCWLVDRHNHRLFRKARS